MRGSSWRLIYFFKCSLFNRSSFCLLPYIRHKSSVKPRAFLRIFSATPARQARHLQTLLVQQFCLHFLLSFFLFLFFAGVFNSQWLVTGAVAGGHIGAAWRWRPLSFQPRGIPFPTRMQCCFVAVRLPQRPFLTRRRSVCTCELVGGSVGVSILCY